MQKPGIPGFTVLPDHFDSLSGSVADQDLFGLEDRLGPIFDIIRHKDSAAPLSLALYGGAGTGKTTALRWLEEQMLCWNQMSVEERQGHPRVLPVWFAANDWEAMQSPVRSMVMAIVLKCLKNLPDHIQRSEFNLRAIELCGPFLGAEFSERLGHIPPEGISGADKGYASEHSCLKFVEEWAECWMDAGDAVRIVLLLDDLDHCSGGHMIGVLDSMVSKIRSASIMFVAGLDQTVAGNLIARHFREHGYDEQQIRHYLGKVFQGECHIEPSSQQVQAFFQEQIRRLDQQSGHLVSRCLTGDFRAYVNEALMQLSGGNPRKIKLLLNSGMMKAHHAGLERTGDADQLFARRIQIYLLQRWLSHFSCGASAIQRKEVQDWFSNLSEEACKQTSSYEKLIKPRLVKDEDDPYGLSAGGGMSGGMYSKGANIEPPEGCSFEMIQEWVWDLLKIPFNSDIAAAPVQTPKLEHTAVANEEESEPDASYENVSGASQTLKEAVAAALEKPIQSISDQDFKVVSHLDFSGKKLTVADLELISKMTAVRRLDLSNSDVADLSWVTELDHLNRLNLTCTKVMDLSPLMVLDHLQFLDLSYTAIKDLVCLAEMEHLETLVLYGSAVQSISGLVGMPGLVRLNLSHTDVNDDTMDVIPTLPKLKSLFLRGTAVSSERVSELNQRMNYQLQIEV